MIFVNEKSEEFFIKYLKTLPNSHIKQFYNDVEWTPYPVLIIKEFQRRFKPKDAEFLDKLLESVDDAKKKGQKIGKLAKIRGIKLSQRVKLRAKKTVSKKITKAKRMIRSSNDNVELIKKLGELKKAGIITNKEFQTKAQNYSADAANQTDVTNQARQKELESMQQNLQEFRDSASQELQKKQMDLMTPLLEKARDAINKVGKDQGFNYVIDSSPNGGVILANGKDLLEDVKKELGF